MTEPLLTEQSAQDGHFPENPADTLIGSDSVAMYLLPEPKDTFALEEVDMQERALRIFGRSSSVAEYSPPAENGHMRIENARGYQYMSFILLILYLVAVYLRRKELLCYFTKTLQSVSLSRKDERIPPLKGLFNPLVITGFYALGIVAARAVDMVSPGVLWSGLPYISVWMPVLVLLICIVIGMIQRGIVGFYGSVTYQRELASGMIKLKNSISEAAALVTIPVAILLALSGPDTAIVLFVVYLLLLATAAVSYIVFTVWLFLRQKVSILFWFLYLCTVETIPIAVLVLAILRNI